MPALVVPGTVQARLVWSVGAPVVTYYSILHGIVPAEFEVADHVVDMATAVGAAASTAGIEAYWSSTASITRLELQDLRSDVVKEATSTVTGVVGLATGNTQLPRDVQLVVTLRTNRRGRSYNGRIFIPGWAEVANTSGVAEPAVVTAAQGFIAALRTNWIAEDFALAIMSRKLKTSEAVTSIICRDANWDTLRRRDR